MKSLNQSGLDSLRTFSIVRSESTGSSEARLVGRLSPGVHLSDGLMCLIGIHGSWFWINRFLRSEDSDLISISTDNCEHKEGDDILYLLPSQFQPPIAFILLNPEEIWEEAVFGSKLAAKSKFIDDQGMGWSRLRPVGDVSELEDGETPEADGWDHEHCGLCNKHITRGDTYFFKAWGEGGSFLCAFCHDCFATTHSIREVIYPGEGERTNEEA